MYCILFDYVETVLKSHYHKWKPLSGHNREAVGRLAKITARPHLRLVKVENGQGKFGLLEIRHGE